MFSCSVHVCMLCLNKKKNNNNYSLSLSSSSSGCMHVCAGLLQLADLYCEFSLKEQCSRLLCRQINDENMLSLYLLSLQYKLKVIIIIIVHIVHIGDCLPIHRSLLYNWNTVIQKRPIYRQAYCKVLNTHKQAHTQTHMLLCVFFSLFFSFFTFFL